MTEGQRRKGTAVAHPNIALVKYWGKRDESLLLPHQSSLSVTLASLEVRTTVELGHPEDLFILNGKRADGEELRRVKRVLEQFRHGCAKVVSEGNFPAAAGLASSAAGFAALAVALRAAAGLPRDVKEESKLARLGSGSAARSIQGGVCVWRRGEATDGSDSFAEQLVPESHWPELRLLVAVVSRAEKAVKSRDGMRETVRTSPYYPAWVEDAEAEVPRAEKWIRQKNLPELGALAERNAWRMHATALAADPPLCYLRPETLSVVLALGEARKRGLPVWFTLDAGPNPVLLTDASHEAEVEALARAHGATEVTRCRAGGDARTVEQHLF